ncbi:WAT1-related protein [Nymphaea thermarum]|nr:WAT1-related protein [Nymphaea thermarum]
MEVEKMKPVVLMVMVQVVLAGMNVLYKLSVAEGISLRVLIAYRFLFGAALLCPFAFFAERKNRTKLTWMVVGQAFCCGFFGSTLAQNFYISAMRMTSATFVSAMANLLPAITFVLAILFRLERLAIRTAAGQAKVVGTLICIAGAMLLTFYKGPSFNFWTIHAHLLHHHAGGLEPSNPSLGSLLATASNFCYAMWLIIQAKMTERYPHPYSNTALICLMAAIQSTFIAAVTDRDPASWKLAWNVKFLTVAYAGILVTALMMPPISWCLQKRGPLFVSVFNPLMLIIVALLGSLLLDEILHLGSILGAALIIVGLYSVLWGKGKEMQKIVKLPSRRSSAADSAAVCPESQASDRDEKSEGSRKESNPPGLILAA